MAAFIKPIAYGTNVAFFRTADSHTSSTMPTPLPWPTPSPTPIHLFHLQPIIILLTIQIYPQFHSAPTSFSTSAPGPGDHLFGQASMLHSSWPTMTPSPMSTSSPTPPTFPSVTTPPQLSQPNMPLTAPSHPGIAAFASSGRFEPPTFPTPTASFSTHPGPTLTTPYHTSPTPDATMT